jgi:hypothetical protein
MVIAETDIHFRLSGGAANADPNLSLGGAKSSVSYTSDVANAIWDNVSGAQSSSGIVEYRCWYVHNANATLTLYGAVIWISSPTDSPGDELDIGLEPGAVNAVAQGPLANEATAPTGVTFSRPSSFGAGLIIGDIGPGQAKAIWERRTVNAGAAAKTDNRATIMVRGETPE